MIKIKSSLLLFSLIIFFSCNSQINSIKGIDSKREITVAFIGGSITEGTGASVYDSCYAVRTLELLRKKYPSVKINGANYGIGSSTSNLGVYRISQMVEESKPDIVVVEFAVNDLVIDEKDIGFNHAAIFKQLFDKNIQVVSLNLNVENGGTRYEFIKDIAPDNGIVDVRVNMQKGDFVDGIHPNNLGHKKIAELLESGIEKIKFDDLKVKSETDFSFLNLDTAGLFLPEINSWQTGKGLSQMKKSCFSTNPYMEMNLNFYGNRIGVVCKTRNDRILQNSKMKFYIDGEFVDSLMVNSTTYESVLSPIIAENLKNEKHQLKIVYSPIDTNKTSYHEILSFMLSGKGQIYLEQNLE